MCIITSKELATEYAINYLEKKEYEYAKCIGVNKIPQEFKALWADLIEGEFNIQTDLWQVSFIHMELEEGATCSANDFAVFVESEHGNCGVFFSM